MADLLWESYQNQFLSQVMLKLISDDIEAFILAQLDKCGLGHNVFTQDAIALITRSSNGILRRIRNLALSSMLEAVRVRTKSIGIDIVNKVLIQPHWRNEYDMFTENNKACLK